jgi:uncharacterized membrane protein
MPTMQESSRVEPVVESGTNLGLERLIFFSDAVMAIAITLLALDVRLPDVQGLTAAQLPRTLADMGPQFLAFGLSFFMIGSFWGAHHRIFLYIKHYDRGLLWLNLLFLFLVTAMPFVTSVLARFNGTLQAVLVYAAVVAAIGLVRAGMWRYATHHRRLVAEDLPAGLIRTETWTALLAAAGFLASIGIAMLNPFLAELSWTLAGGLTFLVRGRA